LCQQGSPSKQNTINHIIFFWHIHDYPPYVWIIHPTPDDSTTEPTEIVTPSWSFLAPMHFGGTLMPDFCFFIYKSYPLFFNKLTNMLQKWFDVKSSSRWWSYEPTGLPVPSNSTLFHFLLSWFVVVTLCILLIFILLSTILNLNQVFLKIKL
jgi:hypothetical protein